MKILLCTYVFPHKNGIAVRAWDNKHRVDWENASVLKQEHGYWKRRVREAI